MTTAPAIGGRWPEVPEVTHRIVEGSIQEYAELSRDYNPLHVDREYARRTRFGSVIAHGPLALQTVFESVTTWLDVEALPPGVSIDVAYKLPVRPGDTVTSRVEHICNHAGTLMLTLAGHNQQGDTVIEALVSVPRHLAPRATTKP